MPEKVGCYLELIMYSPSAPFNVAVHKNFSDGLGEFLIDGRLKFPYDQPVTISFIDTAGLRSLIVILDVDQQQLILENGYEVNAIFDMTAVLMTLGQKC